MNSPTNLYTDIIYNFDAFCLKALISCRGVGDNLCLLILCCSINPFTGFQITKPRFKGSVIDRQNDKIAEPPVYVECFTRVTIRGR